MASKKQTLSFEQSLSRLEEIVRHLEKGDLPLNDSLALYEEGVLLSEKCRKSLEGIETQIKIIGESDED